MTYLGEVEEICHQSQLETVQIVFSLSAWSAKVWEEILLRVTDCLKVKKNNKPKPHMQLDGIFPGL